MTKSKELLALEKLEDVLPAAEWLDRFYNETPEGIAISKKQEENTRNAEKEYKEATGFVLAEINKECGTDYLLLWDLVEIDNIEDKQIFHILNRYISSDTNHILLDSIFRICSDINAQGIVNHSIVEFIKSFDFSEDKENLAYSSANALIRSATVDDYDDLVLLMLDESISVDTRNCLIYTATRLSYQTSDVEFSKQIDRVTQLLDHKHPAIHSAAIEVLGIFEIKEALSKIEKFLYVKDDYVVNITKKAVKSLKKKSRTSRKGFLSKLLRK